MSEAEDKLFFDKEKQLKAINWITEKTPQLTCECCGTKEWELGPDLVVAPLFRGGFIMGGPVSPQFTIICKNCGNTKFFNAIVSKIIDANGGKDGD